MRKRYLKRAIALLLTLLLATGACLSAAAAAPNPNSAIFTTQAGAPSADGIAADQIVTVVVELDDAAALDVPQFADNHGRQSALSVSSVALEAAEASFRKNAVNEQLSVQEQILAIDADAQFRYHYTNLLNGFAAKIRFGNLDAVRALPGVSDVYMTMTYTRDTGVEEGASLEYAAPEAYADTYGALSDDAAAPNMYSDFSVFSDAGSTTQLGLESAWNAGFTGAGKVVAVFDSSLRHTHELFQYMDPDIVANNPNYRSKANIQAIIDANPQMNLFNEGWGSWFHGFDHTGFDAATQSDIRNGGFWRNEKVSFAVDYCNGDLEVWDGDTSSHGTHVSGIVTGNPGPDKINGVKGAAYDAQLFFFKVFDIADPFGQESDEAVFAALDDAVTLNVNAFNLSLGIPNGFSTMNTYAQRGYQKAYNRAKAAGISVAMSSGNDARDTHPGGLVSGYTTLLPNSGKVGFSGSLFGPMTTASNQGTGYSYKNYYNTTSMSFVDALGSPLSGEIYSSIGLTDNNTTPVGTARDGRYQLVNCGNGSLTEIAAAGDLTGKAALIKRGGTDEQGVTLSFVVKQQNAFDAGAAVVVMFDNAATGNTVLSGTQLWDTEKMPTFGMFPQARGNELVTALAATPIYVTFLSSPAFNEVSQTYADSGPVGSTSWGVTEALRLKPDVMAPGGSILSAGAANDKQLSLKSGTSMASPNAEGSYILIQQAVDKKIGEGVFNVAPKTQAYSNLIDQLTASTTRVYKPLTGTTDVYFSPRRQGAGLIQVNKAIESNVLLHSNIAYNAETGEAPRCKVELGDKLGDTFEFTFALENFNSDARTFDVRSCLQTDAVTLLSSTGRYNLVAPSSNGADIDPIRDAVITIKSVQNGTVDTGSENINAYSTTAIAPATITVPARAIGASAAQVTVSVRLGNMTTRDARFPNGMFLDGFVFLDCTSNTAEDVNIPFMGFRGDWLKAPIFDFQNAYADITGMATSNPTYPLFQSTALATRDIVGGVSKESPLGANLTVRPWPGYATSGVAASVRTYFNALRTTNNLKTDYIAFSPNGDSLHDFVYANLALLRNAKALCIVIRDAQGQVVKTIGPDYEYFELYDSDGNGTQQIAATFGTKYQRKLQWDGTDANGSVVADGVYSYEIRAMLEYEYLNKALSADAPATVLNELLTSPTVQLISLPVKVDTVAPTASTTLDANGNLTVTGSDAGGGLMSVELFYENVPLGVKQINGTAGAATFTDIAAMMSAAGIVNPDNTKLSVQVTDYACNIATMGITVSKVSTGTNSSAPVKKGKTLTLTPVFAPSTVAGIPVQYSSSNPAVASVSASGVILGIKPGMAIITIKALDGSGQTAAVLVTVTM